MSILMPDGKHFSLITFLRGINNNHRDFPIIVNSKAPRSIGPKLQLIGEDALIFDDLPPSKKGLPMCAPAKCVLHLQPKPRSLQPRNMLWIVRKLILRREDNSTV